MGNFGFIVVGMQFLTSAFLLPYLALGSVGLLSIVWSVIGRQDEYGSDLYERYTSFIQLLSIDRVGSSFIVDIIIFALFQCWFIDDDLLRRGVGNSNSDDDIMVVL